MDSMVSAAARALAAGDALGALKRVALRKDPPALALRGIAMAQLGDFARARELLRRAARAFGPHEPKARARCLVAEAEVALALRDFTSWPRSLSSAVSVLEAHGDRANAMQGRLLALRRHLLLGRLAEAEAGFEHLDLRGFSPLLVAVAELGRAELAWRRLRVQTGRAAFARAVRAAERAQVPALLVEVREARARLERPAARRRVGTQQQFLGLEAVASLLESGSLVIDACQRVVRQGPVCLPFARRPVPFALARALGDAWPGDVDRQALMREALGARRPGESDRARLRVEVGRLRRLLVDVARIVATPRGFALSPTSAADVVVLEPPIEGPKASLLALLADGTAWSTSALALALGAHQRTVQRALGELEVESRVQRVGQARAQRWVGPPLIEFTTILLLPASLPVE